MKKQLGFGIVGSGSIAETHLKSIMGTEGAKLSAIYTRTSEMGEKLKTQYQIPYYTNYEEFLNHPELDIVCILTPSGTHADFGTPAAQKGKHVVVEKPIDIQLERADRLISACKEAKVKLSCIFQHRFDDSIRDIKLALEQGEFGTLNFGAARTTWYRSQEYYDSGAWRGTWELDGGGALMNQSIHYIDLLLYVMGPVEEVFGYCATRGHERIEVEDIAVASIKFKNGALGLIEGNTAAYPGYNASLEIFGQDAGVVVKNDEIEQWHFRNGKTYEKPANEDSRSNSAVSSNKLASYESHKRQYADIINAINEEREPLITGEEARKSLKVVLAIYESAKTGKPVKF